MARIPRRRDDWFTSPARCECGCYAVMLIRKNNHDDIEVNCPDCGRFRPGRILEPDVAASAAVGFCPFDTVLCDDPPRSRQEQTV